MSLPSLLTFLSADPALRLLQGLLLGISTLVVFLVFFTLRDVLLRSRHFGFQLFAILLVAFLPVFGFLIYLLIRPSRTLTERKHDRWLKELHDLHVKTEKEEKKEEKKEKHAK
jgi:hypothetical protein